MGKKKGKHGGKHHRHDDARLRIDIPPPIAGIAAVAIEQVNTPAFRQLIAGALGAAAQAFDQRRTPREAPVPSAANEPRAARAAFAGPDVTLSTEATRAIERVADHAGRAIDVAAEAAAQAIETAAGALERWAEQQAARARTDRTDARPRD